MPKKFEKRTIKSRACVPLRSSSLEARPGSLQHSLQKVLQSHLTRKDYSYSLLLQPTRHQPHKPIFSTANSIPTPVIYSNLWTIHSEITTCFKQMIVSYGFHLLTESKSLITSVSISKPLLPITKNRASLWEEKINVTMLSLILTVQLRITPCTVVIYLL